MYLSEKMGVMTSMNLYDFSSKNNREVGIVTDQRRLLKDFKYYIEELLTNEDIIPKKSFLDKVMDSFSDEEEGLFSVEFLLFVDEGKNEYVELLRSVIHL